MEARGKGPGEEDRTTAADGRCKNRETADRQDLPPPAAKRLGPHPRSPNGPLVAIIKIKQGKRCGGANQLRLINWENNLTVMEMSMEQSNSLPPIHQSSD